MSHFKKLSHMVWHCQYPIAWILKYRFRILNAAVGKAVEQCIKRFSEQKGL